MKIISKKSKTQTNLVLILGFLVIGDLLIAAAVVYFLSPSGSKTLETLRSIPLAVLWTWGAGTFVFLFAMGTILALRLSRNCPEEFAEFSREIGVEPLRKWGFDGSFGRISFFGYGPYDVIPYKGLPLKYCQLVPDLFPRGGRLSLSHSRPLPLRIMCKYRLKGVLTEARRANEFKDIFAGKLDLGWDDLEAWAVEKEEAASLFRDNSVVAALATLQAEIAKPVLTDQDYSLKSGFIINRKAVVVIFEDAAAISGNLVDSMHRLSTALTNSTISMPDSSSILDRLYKPVVISLVVLTVVAVVTQMTAAALEFLAR